jgi:hypothetical protein
MPNLALAQFLRRIPAGMTGLHADVTTAFAIADRVAERAATIRSDSKLSPAGKAAALAEALDAGPRAHLKQLSEKTKAAIENIKARRAGLAPQKPRDETPVGEMRRQELRAYLRGLDQAERHRVALSGDPEVEEAILFGPAALSGLSPEVHSRVRDLHVCRFPLRFDPGFPLRTDPG